METKAHHALVGLFVVSLAAAGVFFSLWLSQAALDREFTEYEVVFDGAVRGLSTSSEVRFNGIQVGEVTELGLNRDNPTQVIARIRVDESTPVRTDSFAQLEPQGITGLSYVQISPGNQNSPLLRDQPNDGIPQISARAPQLEDLIEGGEDLLATAQTTFGRVNYLLDEENRESLRNILNNIETLTGTFAEDQQLLTDIQETLNSINDAANELSTAARTFDQFSRDAQALTVNDITPMVADVSAASISVDKAAQDFYVALEAVSPGLEEFSKDGLSELTTSARDLRSLIAALERIALELEENPTSFISQQSGEEIEVPQ
jgi:phospholipid/cholesterol/gamma-HCH transport system substrate-binding protein